MIFDTGPVTEAITKQMTEPLIPKWIMSQLDGGGIITDTSSAISDAVVGPAVLIALLFFLLSLVELGMSERMNVEMFTKFFAKFIAAFILINSTSILIENIALVSGWIDEEIQETDIKGVSDANILEDGEDSDVDIEGTNDMLSTVEEALDGLLWYERAMIFVSTNIMKTFSFIMFWIR